MDENISIRLICVNVAVVAAAVVVVVVVNVVVD